MRATTEAFKQTDRSMDALGLMKASQKIHRVKGVLPENVSAILRLHRVPLHPEA